MTKLHLFLSSALVVAGAGSAAAADFVPPPIYTPPPVYTPVAPVYNWTGPYAGVLAGYGWSGVPGFSNPAGAVAGAYIGYNAQGGGYWVLGAEADLLWSGRRANDYDINWTSSFRLRAGYAVGSFLPYVTAGLAIAGTDDNGVNTATEFGYTVGAGIEAALTTNLVGRVEYLYSNYGSINWLPASPPLSTSEVRVGLGFRF